MELTDYKMLLMETITNEYPIYYQNQIIKVLRENGYVNTRKRKKGKQDNEQLQIKDTKKIDLSELDNTKEKIILSIEQVNNSVGIIEKMEYSNQYRHCAIFKYDNLDNSNINKCISDGIMVDSKHHKFKFDNVDYTASKPSYRKFDNDNIALKFSFELSNINDSNKKIKYVVLAVFHKSLNLLEIRFNRVSFEYKKTLEFYRQKINAVKAWIGLYLKVEVKNINLKSIVNYIRTDCDSDEVKITAKDMSRNGMRALLDSNSNEEMKIPILDELKDLIRINRELFDKSPQIKTLLVDFIDEIEETSDLPMVKIAWLKKNIKIGISHDYKNQEYSLFQYYNDLKDMERMDYVTGYLHECKRKLDAKTYNQ